MKDKDSIICFDTAMLVAIFLSFSIFVILVYTSYNCEPFKTPKLDLDNRPKVLSISCYGYGNIGDNMYSGVFKRYLERDCNVFKIRDNRMFVDSEYNLSSSPPSNDWKYDALLIGGGGLLNKEKLNNSNTMRHYISKAMKNNKPIFIISCGIQTDDNFGSDWKELWNYASLITVRSPEDKRIILKNTPKANVKYQRDLGYIAPHCGVYERIENEKTKLTMAISGPVNPSSSEVKKIIEETKPQEIVVMNTGARFDKDMKEWIDSANFPGIKTTKLYGEGIANEFNFKDNERGDLNVQSTIQVINDSFLVLSGRYHGMVFARSLGIPCNTMGMGTNKIKWEQPLESLDKIVQSSYENIRLLKQGLGLPDTSDQDLAEIMNSLESK